MIRQRHKSNSVISQAVLAAYIQDGGCALLSKFAFHPSPSPIALNINIGTDETRLKS